MLRLAATALVLIGTCAQVAPNAPSFDFDRTIRVDYRHTGGPSGEQFVLDAIVLEREWPGSRTQLIDTTDLGKYFLEVVDRSSNRVIYSRGFASMYGEWETTAEFRATERTFHETVRFPRPHAPVRIALAKRDAANVFRPIWTHEVDPSSARAAAGASGAISTLIDSGAPSRKVDVLLVSDGYGAAQGAKFRADARRLVNALFELEPFKSRRGDFNVHMLHVPASSIRVEFNIFGLERYALSNDNRALRDAAAAAPYDVIEILANETKYGGGGIFNQQSTVAAGHESAGYVFIHELAHNLAGLGDEYVGSVTYETGAMTHTEPWEPNITALHDVAALKWRDLVEPGTPIPTPMSYAGKVGAFEGAGYQARGIYRPEAACIMGTRKVMNFCRVCQRAISRIIDLHTS
ncbi:MAG TPA: M64 family metallopeptidase [Vicinamibacterales bacterium]|nr:M64 family metallopeptidase [Vicinamibacterales bacterium]